MPITQLSLRGPFVVPVRWSPVAALLLSLLGASWQVPAQAADPGTVIPSGKQPSSTLRRVKVSGPGRQRRPGPQSARDC